MLNSDDAAALDRLTLGGPARLHLPDREPGAYVLAFEGDFGTVYSVNVGLPY